MSGADRTFSLQELSWRCIVSAFENLTNRGQSQQSVIVFPKIIIFLERLPSDWVLETLRTRTFTNRLSLSTLLHHLAVAPSKAPTSLDFSRSQRFNLASLLSFLAPPHPLQPDFRVASPPPSPSASPNRISNEAHRTTSPPPSPASTINVVIERIRLTLRNLKSLSLQSNLYLNDVILMQLLSLCPQLTTLNISYCKKVSCACISKVLAARTSLTSLDLSWTGITDSSLEAMVGLTNLQELHMGYCRSITDEGLAALLSNSNMASLVSLDLRGCHLENAKLQSSSLKHLNLSHNRLLSPRALFEMDCPNLEELSLASCPQINDEALSSLLGRCGSLVHLDVQFCSFADPVVNAPSLRALFLNDCKCLSNRSLQIIAKNCTQLTEVHLRDTRVTDETIGIFAENGQLERVNISRCPRLTNEGIRALVQRCTYLHEIDVSWLSLLTEVAVAHLETARYLKILKVFGCTAVSSVALAALQASQPSLTIFSAQTSLDYALFSAIS